MSFTNEEIARIDMLERVAGRLMHRVKFQPMDAALRDGMMLAHSVVAEGIMEVVHLMHQREGKVAVEPVTAVMPVVDTTQAVTKVVPLAEAAKTENFLAVKSE